MPGILTEVCVLSVADPGLPQKVRQSLCLQAWQRAVCCDVPAVILVFECGIFTAGDFLTQCSAVKNSPQCFFFFFFFPLMLL